MGTTEPLDLFTPFQIPLQIMINTEDFTILTQFLPKQYIDYSIRVSTGLRCTIHYGRVLNRGGYGSILLAHRIDLSGNSQEICVKSPHVSTFSSCPEAILQWIASNALIETGIIGAIPLVYDIFQYAGESRFSMSYVKGISCVAYIINSSTPETVLVEILIQVSILLGYLEEKIHLDHRDLKADNIWIRLEPVDYSVKISGKLWKCRASFQVVLLDFGFSCLGNSEGVAVVSLSDGILPRIDPCPKEGRDLFQFILSITSIPQIREKIGDTLWADIDLLLSYKNKYYIHQLRKNTTIHWVYLLVSDMKFHHPPLHPVSLLKMIRIKYPHLTIQCE